MASQHTVLVGAFERDNFGDELFRAMTSPLFDGGRLDFAAPFLPNPELSADAATRPTIYRYRDLFGGGGIDNVWVVGGEVGGTTMDEAYSMTATEDAWQAYLGASSRSRRHILSDAYGGPWWHSPYLPSIPRSLRGTRLVVNSVGVSGMPRLPLRTLLAASGTLRRATYVSVRDRRSSLVCAALGIRHKLLPDLVHTLEVPHEPLGSQAVAPSAERLALVQARESLLDEVGVHAFAQSLLAVEAIRGWRLNLFSAGTARFHDSRERYERLQRELTLAGHFESVALAPVGSAADRVRQIATASLWIGTSLHGMIVASAAGVPRVSLPNAKVARYCRTWSDPMPSEASLPELPDAVSHALNPSTLDAAARFQTACRDLARRGLDAALASVRG